MLCDGSLKQIQLVILVAAVLPTRGVGQELFPHTEPASNIPAHVLGLRLASESYDEVGQPRNWLGLKVMYGVTSDLMVTQTVSFSNHHGGRLPADFVTTDGGLGAMHTHGTTKGAAYPYLFETYNLNLKYRFYVSDSRNEHLRAAVWGEVAFGNEAHDEAEPTLMGDNAGWGGGVIVTKLYKRFAVSLGLGGIIPWMYKEDPDNLTFQYGNTLTYSLSLGYLLLPTTYRDYSQVNVNLYAEFLGKTYDAAEIHCMGEKVIIDNVPALSAGSYMELRPALQFIFWSNTRLDLSSSFLIHGDSYTKLYPVFYFNLQHYFYL
jgi:hypothetical protein